MNSVLTGQFALYILAGVALVLAALQANGEIDIVTPVQDFLSAK